MTSPPMSGRMTRRGSRRFGAAALFALAVWGLSAVALADSKADARRYFTRGMAAIEAGRLREGVSLLESAYAIRPHPNVLFNLAPAHAALGELRAAVSAFEGYLASNPPDAEQVRATIAELEERRELRSLVARGMRAISAGRPLEGVGFLRRAREIRPHPNLDFNIGRAYEDAEEFAAAVQAYRRYLRSNPDDAADVKDRIERLVAELNPPAAPAAVAAAPEPRRSRRAPKEAAPRPQTANSPGVAGAPRAFTEAELERIAEAVAARLEARLPAPAPLEEVSPEPESEEQERRQVTVVDDILTSTASLAPTEVALEAKSDEAYRDVVVTASRRAQSPLEAPNAVTILTEEDIRLSGARTIPDLLRRVPGVDVMAMSFADYNVAVRGFNRRLANKVLVLIDNRTVYADFIGATSWRTLPVELEDIERIEVVRGPGSAVYGAYAYTGIINIITKRPEALDGAVAQVAAGNGDVVEGSFQYGKQDGRVGMRLSAGYQRGDVYELGYDSDNPSVSTGLDDPETSLEVARVNGLLEVRLSDSGPEHIYVGGSYAHAKHEQFGVANLRNQRAVGPELHLRAGYEGELLTLRTFWARFEKDTRPSSTLTGLPPLESSLVNDVVSFEPIFHPRFELGGEHRLVLGGEYRFKAIQWNWISGDQTEHHFAAYFQDQWRLAPDWSVVLSGRLDLHPLIGPLGSPRLAVIHQLGEGQALRLSVGTAFRVPTMAETYLELSANVPANPATAVTLVGGGDALDPEGIATLELGYLLDGERGALEAAAYVNRVTNLITRSPLDTSAGGTYLEDLAAVEVARSVYVNDSRAFIAVGGELAGRIYPIDGLDLGGSYAFQYIFDEATGERFTDSPLHKISLWGLLRTEMGLDAGLSAHFVSSQDWVEPDYDPSSPTGFDVEPLPVDASVNLIGRVGWRLLDDRLELGVSGVNLLDVGSARHREHPFGNRLEARLLDTLTGRM